MIVFDKTWFVKHQTKLIKMLNVPGLGHAFKLILSIPTKYLFNPVVKIGIGNCHFKKNKTEYEALFYTRPVYAVALHDKFYEFWKLCHWFDTVIANKYQPAWNLGFDTLTVYTPAGTGGAGVDGQVTKANQTTWALAHDASTGTANSIGTTGTATSSYPAASVYEIRRLFFAFNTTSLPSSNSISNAVFNVRRSSSFAYTNHLTNWTATGNPTSLTSGDYSKIDYTSQASNNTSSAGWKTFTLSNLSVVKASEYTKLAIINAYDYLNYAPPLGTTYSSTFNLADGATYVPYLTVTYTSIPLYQNII